MKFPYTLKNTRVGQCALWSWLCRCWAVRTVVMAMPLFALFPTQEGGDRSAPHCDSLNI